MEKCNLTTRAVWIWGPSRMTARPGAASRGSRSCSAQSTAAKKSATSKPSFFGGGVMSELCSPTFLLRPAVKDLACLCTCSFSSRAVTTLHKKQTKKKTWQEHRLHLLLRDSPKTSPGGRHGLRGGGTHRWMIPGTSRPFRPLTAA